MSGSEIIAPPDPYCVRLIAEADEDFRLSIGYAPAAAQARLAALFAFLIELRRIPASVSEAPLGEIRLQWHREALDEIAAGKRPRAHPVIEALAASVDVSADRGALERLIDARARLLYEPRFTSLDDLRAFLRSAEAPIAALALDRTGSPVVAAVEALGEAHALARLAPALAPALATEAASAALGLIAGHASALAGLSAEAFGCVAYLALTRGHAARTRGEVWPVMKRIALFKAVATGRI
jgi:phytoene synthase